MKEMKQYKHWRFDFIFPQIVKQNSIKRTSALDFWNLGIQEAPIN